MRSGRLPVRDIAADGWLGARGPVFHSGLQRAPQEPGSPLSEPGGGAALGTRLSEVAREGGQYDPEGKTGPISFK